MRTIICLAITLSSLIGCGSSDPDEHISSITDPLSIAPCLGGGNMLHTHGAIGGGLVPPGSTTVTEADPFIWSTAGNGPTMNEVGIGLNANPFPGIFWRLTFSGPRPQTGGASGLIQTNQLVAATPYPYNRGTAGFDIAYTGRNGAQAAHYVVHELVPSANGQMTFTASFQNGGDPNDPATGEVGCVHLENWPPLPPTP